MDRSCRYRRVEKKADFSIKYKTNKIMDQYNENFTRLKRKTNKKRGK